MINRDFLVFIILVVILTKDSKKSPASTSGRWIAFFVKKFEKRIYLWYNLFSEII